MVCIKLYVLYSTYRLLFTWYIVYNVYAIDQLCNQIKLDIMYLIHSEYLKTLCIKCMIKYTKLCIVYTHTYIVYLCIINTIIPIRS